MSYVLHRLFISYTRDIFSGYLVVFVYLATSYKDTKRRYRYRLIIVTTFMKTRKGAFLVYPDVEPVRVTCFLKIACGYAPARSKIDQAIERFGLPQVANLVQRPDGHRR